MKYALLAVLLLAGCAKEPEWELSCDSSKPSESRCFHGGYYMPPPGPPPGLRMISGTSKEALVRPEYAKKEPNSTSEFVIHASDNDVSKTHPAAPSPLAKQGQ